MPTERETWEDQYIKGRWAGYTAYLRTNHWRTVHRKCVAHYHGRCAWCKTSKCRQFHAHHISYDHLWEEVVGKDVVLLCEHCHSRIHGKQARKTKQKKSAARWRRHHRSHRQMPIWETAPQERELREMIRFMLYDYGLAQDARGDTGDTRCEAIP